MDDSLYPFEFLVEGTPISLQSANARRRQAWKDRIAEAARERQRATYELGFLETRPLSVTIYYFSGIERPVDIDNIVKPILDALVGIAYLDDNVVERLVVRRLKRGEIPAAGSSSAVLANALLLPPPVVYVLVEDDLRWRTRL